MKYTATIIIVSLLTFTASAQSVKRAKVKQSTTTPAPAPLPTLSINSVSVSEGGGAAVPTITKSGNTTQTVTVNFATVSGTATAPADFKDTVGTLYFLPSEFTKQLPVRIVDDALVEGAETFTVVLSNPGNATIATGTGTVTIVDNDTVVVLPPPPPPPTCTYVVQAADYGVSSANTDNRAALLSCFNYLATLPETACKRLVMPAGADIRIATKFFYNGAAILNLEIEMNGAKIRSTIPCTDYSTASSGIGSNYTMLFFRSPQIFSRQAVLQNITSRSTSFRISQTNATRLRAGDIVVINTTKPDPYYDRGRQGGYKLVQSVNTTTGDITVTTPFWNDSTLIPSTDAVTVTAFRPHRNWKIHNGTFELYAGSRGTALYLEHFEGLHLTRLLVDGKAVMQGDQRGFAPRTTDSNIGIGVHGYNVLADSIEVRNFWDFDRSHGYASIFGGENHTVRHSTFRHAKKSVDASGIGYYNNNTLVEYNTMIDAAVGGHADSRNFIIQYNKMSEVGAGASGFGMSASTYHSVIRRNEILGASTNGPGVGSTVAIRINGVAGGLDARIDSNVVFNTDRALDANYSNSLTTGAKIRGNTFTVRGNGVTLHRVYNVEFTGNTLSANGWGLWWRWVSGCNISNNSITYGLSSFGSGVYFETVSTTGWNNSSITNNTITGGSLSSRNIRIGDGYNRLTITGNTLQWPGTRNTLANSIRIDECLTCTQMLIQNNTGSSLNINTLNN